MKPSRASAHARLATGLLLASVSLAACAVGPNYTRPSVATPPQFKEAEGWTPAVPADSIDKGAWWSMFDDPVLDGLERQIDVSNQTLAAAEAAYRESRAIVATDRAQLFPTIGLGASANGSSSASPLGGRTTSRQYEVTADAAWAPDLWGKVRRTIEGAKANAQASAADIANARLSLQAELANDYFELRMTDADKALLRTTIAAYQEALTVTRNKYKVGVAARSDVLTAETQLKSAQAALADLDRQRTAAEHAIAVLVGKPPADLTIEPVANWSPAAPATPLAAPSTLLQRRPDVAAAERNVAAANAQIGVAVAAYYPNLSLSADGGLVSTAIQTLFHRSNTLWSLGADVSETVLDFGARHAAVREARAAYDQAVAQYRETVLTAFQNVEDALAAARVLQDEQPLLAETAEEASQNVAITLNEYKAGTVDYTAVAAAQATALSARESLIQAQAARLTEAVALIQALGGGWSANDKTPAP